MYLLFDADQTIWDFKATERISLKALFDHYHLPDTAETKDAYEIGNLWCWDEFEKGNISLEELEALRMKLFFKNLKREDLDENEAAELYATLLSENGILLNGALDMLESLKDIPKSLVTNGLKKVQRGRLKDTDTEKYFDHIFISQEMGVQKPKKEFFDIVLKTIGRDKDQCIVIGDSEKSDIQGANNSGIRSIYFSPKGNISSKPTWSVSSYQEMIKLIRSLQA